MSLHVADLVGIPWKLGGRTPGGVDCVGLAVLAQRALFGADYSAIAEGYDGDDYEARSLTIRERIARVMTEQTEKRHGDVLLLRFAASLHLGTYLEGGRILHIVDGGRSRINTLGRCFRERIDGIYRGVR